MWYFWFFSLCDRGSRPCVKEYSRQEVDYGGLPGVSTFSSFTPSDWRQQSALRRFYRRLDSLWRRGMPRWILICFWCFSISSKPSICLSIYSRDPLKINVWISLHLKLKNILSIHRKAIYLRVIVLNLFDCFMVILWVLHKLDFLHWWDGHLHQMVFWVLIFSLEAHMSIFFKVLVFIEVAVVVAAVSS